MALSFAHGAVQWLASDVVNTTYVVSGLGFQPKLIRFYWVGIQSASDATSTVLHSRRGVGLAVSTSDRRVVATSDEDLAGTSICSATFRADSVVATPSGTGSDGELDITAIGADGFTLTVDDQAPVNLTVFWEAFGGDAITTVTIGSIAEPASTGDQDYTATGFVAGATDQAVLLAGVHTDGTARANAGLMVGAATGPGSAQGVAATGSVDAQVTMVTASYAKTGECVALCTSAAAGVTAVAALTAFGTNTFRLNWSARATTTRRVIYAAIKGGSWHAGAVTLNGTTGGNTVTKTGLPFAPVGLSVFSTLAAEAASSGVASTRDLLSIGTGTSASSRRAMGATSPNGPTASAIELSLQYDQILTGQVAGTLYNADLSALTSDGFTLVHDGPGAADAAEWIGYLAFGDPPADTADGSGTAALTLGLTGAGVSSRSGTGTSALTLGTTGAGVSIHRGTGTAALVLGTTGVGETPVIAVPDGSGIAVLTLSTAGAGVSVRRGTGTAPLGLSVTGVGESPAIPVAQGDGVVPVILVATGTGDRLSLGSGEALLALEAFGVGSGEFVSMVNVRMSLSKPGLTGTVAHVGQLGTVTRVGGLRVTVDPVMEATEEDEP